MGRVKKLEIKESPAELLKMIRGEKRPLVQARLQALYLYKSGQGQDYGTISEQVGYERHTVGKWFRQYSQQGLTGCQQLAMGKKSGSIIHGQALAELTEKLNSSTEYFSSYKQIHQWLLKEHNLQLSYEHVHRFVRYKLKAKLKVVRKSNLKKDVVKEEKFKTCYSPFC
jgi:transposase